MDEAFKELEVMTTKLDKMLKKSQSPEPKSDLYILNLRLVLSGFKKQLDTIDNEIPYLDEDQQKPMRQRLKTFQSDYDLKKTQVNKIEEQITRKRNIEKFTSGELVGQDARRAERDMIMDFHKETDGQGVLIKEIGKDIRETNQNLKEAGVSVKEQGEQIERIHINVVDADGTVLRTDKRINEMNRRNFCMKILLNLLVLLLFILDVAFLVYKLMKKAGK